MIKSIINPSDIDRFYLKNEYYVEYIDNNILQKIYPNSNLCQGKNDGVFTNEKTTIDDKFLFIINKDKCPALQEKYDITNIPFSKIRNATKKKFWSSSPSSYSFDKLNNSSLVENSSKKENSIKFYDVLDPLYHYLHFFRYQLKMVLKGYKEPYFTISDMVIRSLILLENNKNPAKAGTSTPLPKDYNYKNFILDNGDYNDDESTKTEDTSIDTNDIIETNNDIVTNDIDIIEELYNNTNNYNIDITKNANIQKYYPLLKTTTFNETGIIMELQKYYDIDSTLDQLDNTSTESNFSKIAAKYALQTAVLYIQDMKKKGGNYIFKSKIDNEKLKNWYSQTVWTKYKSYTINNQYNSEKKYKDLIQELTDLLKPITKGGFKNQTKKNKNQYGGIGVKNALGNISKGISSTAKRTARNITNNIVGENPLYDYLNQIFKKTACYFNNKIIIDIQSLFINTDMKQIEENTGYASQPYIYLFVVKTLRKTLSLEKICYTQSRFLHCSKVRKLIDILKSIIMYEIKYRKSNGAKIEYDKVTDEDVLQYMN
jgi:hypothetical protein